MLTGRPPFEAQPFADDDAAGKSIQEGLRKALFTSEVKGAAAFIQACMRRDPEARTKAAALAEHDWFAKANSSRSSRRG
jgi:serine/threonine protein kinase